MSRYESKPTALNKSAEEMFDRFDDLTFFENKINDLPEEARAKLGEVHFDKNSIAIVTPQVGELKFEIIERHRPEKIVFGSPSSPIPLTMEVLLTPKGENASEVKTVIDVEIPAMLRPFVGPKLQQATDKFGEMISNLSKA